MKVEELREMVYASFLWYPDFCQLPEGPESRTEIAASYPPGSSQGQGKINTPSPVKETALARHTGTSALGSRTPNSSRHCGLCPEVVIVAAFGQILPPKSCPCHLMAALTSMPLYCRNIAAQPPYTGLSSTEKRRQGLPPCIWMKVWIPVI